MPRAFPLLTALPLALSACLPAAAAPPGKPSVVFILADDLGHADIGIHKQRGDVKTPHIDQLARDGVLFTDGHVTAPQCSPSRAGIMTGRYQQRFGFDNITTGPLPLTEKTIAERLRAAGYATGMVGKWHLEPNHSCEDWARREHPELAIIDGTVRLGEQLVLKYAPARRGFDDFYWGELQRHRRNYALDGKSLTPEGGVSQTEDYHIDVQTEAGLAFIRRHAGKPFFLYLAYHAPHVPLIATQKYLDRFPGDMPERRRTALAMIAAMDDGVVRMRALLEEKGLLENTIFVFTSDNGAPLGAHQNRTMEDVLPVDKPGPAWDGSRNDPLNGEKGMLAEGGIRVPFIISWPARMARGLVFTKPVISLDATATIHAAAGLPPEPGYDGIDLLPYLTKTEAVEMPARDLFWRFWTQAAVRSGDWKYITAGTDRAMLFNLKDDIGETRNLIAEHPEVAADLRRKLAAWADQLQPAGIPSGPLDEQEAKWYPQYFGKTGKNRTANPGE
jgi:arylsulfatase A-like enzyme